MRLLACVILAAALTPATLRAEAGPPLITDDPGTPERGHWEINLAFTYDQRKSSRDVEAPLLDINYGLMDHLQLKVESPWQFSSRSNPSNSANGPGASLVGLKGRFLDEEKFHVDMSFYPQVEFGGFELTDQRTKAGEPAHLLLPFEVEKKFKPITVGLEFGIDVANSKKPTSFYGLALGHEFKERFELLAELRGMSQPNFRQTELLVNGGFRFKVNKLISLIGSTGTTIRSPERDRSKVFSYFGVQFNF